MQDGYHNIKAAGASELIAISSDNLKGITDLRNSGIKYLLLSDDDEITTIKNYNVREQQGNPFLARPATFIINESGKIAWVDLGNRFGHRTNSNQIVTAFGDL